MQVFTAFTIGGQNTISQQSHIVRRSFAQADKRRHRELATSFRAQKATF
jgi:hypothetical protein